MNSFLKILTMTETTGAGLEWIILTIEIVFGKCHYPKKQLFTVAVQYNCFQN